MINADQLTMRDGAVITADSSLISSGNAGQIEIDANQISLFDGSAIIATVTNQGSQGGILIQNADLVELSGMTANGESASGLFTFLGSNATGSGGDIRILDTNDVTIRHGAQISAETRGNGPAGRIDIANDSTIQAFTTGSGTAGSIILDARDQILFRDNSELSVETSSSGRAGDITLSTGILTLEDTARITATATSTATTQERGGSITLNAPVMNLFGQVGILSETESTTPAGTLTLQPGDNASDLTVTFREDAQASTSTIANGQAGDIIIQAPWAITLQGDGQIRSETSGSARAGTITLTGQHIIIRDGLDITTSTTGTGQGGDVIVMATDSLTVSDARLQTNTAADGQAGTITVQVPNQILLEGENAGLFATTGVNSTANGGSINIDPWQLTIRDGAEVAVNSAGIGQGGEITIVADDLILDRGTIAAITRSNTGGNITLTINELLRMFNTSEISTTAGNEQFGGNGGNITIQAPNAFLIAHPSENSDITANAFSGNGGRVFITAAGIFGLEFREDLTPLSDITASSQLGDQGIVTILLTEPDAQRGLTQLPEQARDPDVANSCQNIGGRDAVELLQIGRGGLPRKPDEPLNAEFSWLPLVEQTQVEPVHIDTLSQDIAHQTTTSLIMAPCQQEN